MTSYRFNVTHNQRSHYPKGTVASEEALRASKFPIESMVRLKIISPIEEPKPKAKPKAEPQVEAKTLGAASGGKAKTRSRKKATST